MKPAPGVVHSILVVDDDQIMLKTTTLILENSGFAVVQASDAKTALRKVRELRPSLVLLDVVLRDQSGTEVLRQIRADPELLGVSVILFSAWQITSENQVDGLNTGADGYIVRPIANAELVARIRAHFRQRELTDQLRNSEAFTAGIVTSAMDAIVSADSEQRIMLFNPAAERMFGCSASDALGMPLVSFLPQIPPISELHGDGFGLTNVVSQAAVAVGLTSGLRANGDSFFIEASISRIGSGPHQLIAVIIRDITERRELETQLRQAQKLKAVGTLAGGIAHDFNNILTGIYGFTELARAQVGGHTEFCDYIDEIARAGRRGAELVRHLLAFSRTQDNDETPGPVLLNAVVNEAVALVQATSPSTVKIIRHIPQDLSPVHGIASQLHQVVMNLGTNAVHAMCQRPGQLTFRLENFPVDDAMARLLPGLQPGLCVRLTVSDTGCGMDAVTEERAFEPFFTTKGPRGGTGLGLAVVHGIVRDHGGAIRLTSEAGRGTAVEVILPVSSTRPPASNAPASTVARGRGERILFVDDEAQITQSCQLTLRQLGYAVESECEVLKALDRFERDPLAFDLVVSDQTMPDMTGLAFAERIRELRPNLPVVLASGNSTAITAENIRDAGVREVLPKPYSMQSLSLAIRRHLPVK